VTFREAVEKTPEIREAWRIGFKALRPADRQHVDAEDTHSLRGSVDVDSTLRDKYPDANRWDYAIGHRPSNLAKDVAYWVEVHPASDGEVKVVLAKLKWLKDWLRTCAQNLNSMHKEFIWVSSGKTSFTLNSPQQKQFALLGLQHKGRVFTIPARMVG
jgi:hypothetical protein